MTTLRDLASLAVALLSLAWMFAKLLVSPPRMALEIGGRPAGFVQLPRRDMLALARGAWASSAPRFALTFGAPPSSAAREERLRLARYYDGEVLRIERGDLDMSPEAAAHYAGALRQLAANLRAQADD